VGAFDSLRYRDYRLMWFGSIVSNVGTWMQIVALSWYVLQLTGSVFWVGAVNFANFAPAWLSPFAGVLADRVDRRKILLATQSSMMVTSAALAILVATGHGSIWPVLLLTLVAGFAFAADAPARQAFFPSLVPRDKMVNAIALNSAQFILARVIGPAIAGAMIATVGPAPVFAINAGSFLAVLVALAAVRSPFDARAVRERPRARLGEGLTYAWRHPVIRPMLLSISVISLFGAPITALLPGFAREVYGRGPQAFGFLTTAMGTGSVLGAVLLGGAGQISPRIIGAGVALSGLALAAFGAAAIFAVGLGLIGVFGGAYLFTISATNGQIQTASEDAIRGRVVSLFMVAFGGLFPVGSLVAGAVAERFGVQVTTIAGAGLCTAWGLGLVMRWRAPPHPHGAAGDIVG
jgi:MFS family permease